MTKSAMVKRIARKLKSWEGSVLTEKTALEILDICEKAGMRPPPVRGKIKLNNGETIDTVDYKWSEK